MAVLPKCTSIHSIEIIFLFYFMMLRIRYLIGTQLAYTSVEID